VCRHCDRDLRIFLIFTFFCYCCTDIYLYKVECLLTALVWEWAWRYLNRDLRIFCFCYCCTVVLYKVECLSTALIDIKIKFALYLWWFDSKPAPEPTMVPAPPSSPMRASEVANLRCSILSASAYIALCLNDYIVALKHCRNLLRQPRLSGAQRYACLLVMFVVFSLLRHCKCIYCVVIN
jgi:hypothetical protein